MFFQPTLLSYNAVDLCTCLAHPHPGLNLLKDIQTLDMKLSRSDMYVLCCYHAVVVLHRGAG